MNVHLNTREADEIYHALSDVVTHLVNAESMWRKMHRDTGSARSARKLNEVREHLTMVRNLRDKIGEL